MPSSEVDGIMCEGSEIDAACYDTLFIQTFPSEWSRLDTKDVSTEYRMGESCPAKKRVRAEVSV